MKFGILLLGLALSALLPQARAADGGRHDIAQQRSLIEARYKEALRACTDRFAVNRCRQAAADERLDALKPLRERELRLDAEERSARAARQRERMEAKQQESTRREGEGQARAVLGAAPAVPPASGPKPAHVPDSAGHARSVQAELKKSEQEAAQRRGQAAERQRQAAAHRDSVLRKQQERPAKPVQTLPTPSAADLAVLPTAPRAASGPTPAR